MNLSESSVVVAEGTLSWCCLADAVFVCSELTCLSKGYNKMQSKARDDGFC